MGKLKNSKSRKNKIPFAVLSKGALCMALGASIFLGGGLLAGCSNAEATPGKDGATWLTGAVAPTATKGKDGDLYLDTETNKIYLKVNGFWSEIGTFKGDPGEDGEKGDPGEEGEKGDPGDPGKDGTTWLTGDEVTKSNLTADVDGAKLGDLYLNTETQDLFKCVDENTWEYITNIKGAIGTQGGKGDPGEEGEKGDPGDPGKDGATWLTGDEVTKSNLAVEVEDSKVGDLYLNTDTQDLFKRIEPTMTGDIWEHVTNIKGDKGEDGETGTQGKPGDPGKDGAYITNVAIDYIYIGQDEYMQFTFTYSDDRAPLIVTVATPKRINYISCESQMFFPLSEVGEEPDIYLTAYYEDGSEGQVKVTKDMFDTNGYQEVNFQQEGVYNVKFNYRNQEAYSEIRIYDPESVQVSYNLSARVENTYLIKNVSTYADIVIVKQEIVDFGDGYTTTKDVASIPLTEEMVVSEAKINFSEPGYYSIEFEWEGATGFVGVDVVDPEQCNIRSIYAEELTSGDCRFPLGADANVLIQQLKESGKTFMVEYFVPVEGQMHAEIPYSEAEFDIANLINVEEAGWYEFSMRYGEYIQTFMVEIYEDYSSWEVKAEYNITTNPMMGGETSTLRFFTNDKVAMVMSVPNGEGGETEILEFVEAGIEGEFIWMNAEFLGDIYFKQVGESTTYEYYIHEGESVETYILSKDMGDGDIADLQIKTYADSNFVTMSMEYENEEVVLGTFKSDFKTDVTGRVYGQLKGYDTMYSVGDDNRLVEWTEGETYMLDGDAVIIQNEYHAIINGDVVAYGESEGLFYIVDEIGNAYYTINDGVLEMYQPDTLEPVSSAYTFGETGYSIIFYGIESHEEILSDMDYYAYVSEDGMTPLKVVKINVVEDNVITIAGNNAQFEIEEGLISVKEI